MFFLYKNWRPHTVFVWQDFSHWEMCRIMIQIYIKKVHTEPLRRGQQPQCCPLSSDTVSCQGMDAHNGRTTEPHHCTRKAFHRALRRFSEHLSLITISYCFLLSSYSKSTKKKKINPCRMLLSQRHAMPSKCQMWRCTSKLLHVKLQMQWSDLPSLWHFQAWSKDMVQYELATLSSPR